MKLRNPIKVFFFTMPICILKWVEKPPILGHIIQGVITYWWIIRGFTIKILIRIMLLHFNYWGIVLSSKYLLIGPAFCTNTQTDIIYFM